LVSVYKAAKPPCGRSPRTAPSIPQPVRGPNSQREIAGGAAQHAKDRISSSATLLKRAIPTARAWRRTGSDGWGKAWSLREDPIEDIDCSLQWAFHDHLIHMVSLVA